MLPKPLVQTNTQVVEADGKQYVVINDASGRARLANTAPLEESEEPRATGLLHGNADCIKQGAPPGERSIHD